MVRLKADYLGLPAKETIGFQFHYGSIKRKNKGLNFSYYLIFQFHYGSIKSRVYSWLFTAR